MLQSNYQTKGYYDITNIAECNKRFDCGILTTVIQLLICVLFHLKKKKFKTKVTDLVICKAPFILGFVNMQSQSYNLPEENKAEICRRNCKLFSPSNKIQCCLFDLRLSFIKHEINS